MNGTAKLARLESGIDRAVALHRRGMLDEAASIYRDLLSQDPNHADSLHLSGVVALQRGDAPQAIAWIGKAIGINPTVSSFHANLAEAFRAMGQLDRALGSCQIAIQLEPSDPTRHYMMGTILQSQEKLDAAIACFRRAVELKPDYASAHNNLANALRQQGKKDEALVHFRKAVECGPTMAEAQTNLGQFLLEMGEAREALPHSREAVRLNPNFPEGRNNLGNVLRDLGRLDEAKTCYAEALRINPTLAMTFSNMGQALQEENKLEDALAWYRQALAREPGSARFHTNIASAFNELDRYDEAFRHYHAALAFDGNYVPAHNGLGQFHHDQNRFDDAMACFRAALMIEPDCTLSHVQIGNIHEELGNFDDAGECYREALRHDSDNVGGLGQLATMLGKRLPAQDEAAIRSLLGDPELLDGGRCSLNFALAHVLDARGSHDQAAEVLTQANKIRSQELRKRNRGYDPADHLLLVDRLIGAFTPDFFTRTQGFGLDTDKPIFVFGLPRSGTTLAEQVLASHSRVHGAGELRLTRETFEQLPVVEGRQGTSIDCLPTLSEKGSRTLATAHLAKLAALGAGKPHVVDKMPDNYVNVGLIATLFPKAKLIHCRRDLRDVAVSWWKTNFSQLLYAFDPADIASRFHQYLRLMDHWQKVLPVPLISVDYEEMVDDLDGSARRMIEACGLEWEPACLEFYKTQRPVRTASLNQVRQPIYKTSAGRWKNYESSLAFLFDAIADCQPNCVR